MNDISEKEYPQASNGSWTDDVIVDFSNPEAREWCAAKIKRLIEMGAGAIKTDFGEGIPVEAHYHSIQGKHFHNVYSLLYNSVVFGAAKAVRGDEIVWARSGTAGSQRYPLHWGGDSLLIAPVLKPLRKSRERRVYLPKGVWHDYFTHDRIESTGMWIRRPVDLATRPIYVRGGTTLRYCAGDRTLYEGMGQILREEYWEE